MKAMKVFLLALAVVAGGNSIGVAQGDNGSSYDLLFELDNLTPVISVADQIPTSPGNILSNMISRALVTTDGSGRIEGTTFIRLGYTQADTNGVESPFAFSDYLATVAGNIITRRGEPVVTLRIVGNGYTAPDTDGVGSNLPLFAQPGSVPSSIQLQFTSTGTPTNIGPNVHMPGVYNGLIRPGSVVDSRPIRIQNEPADLVVNWTQFPALPLGVVSVGNRFFATAGGFLEFPGDFRGSGIVRRDAFTAQFVGTGNMRGSRITMRGLTGEIAFSGTNTINTATNAIITGRIQGQTISGNATNVVLTGPIM